MNIYCSKSATQRSRKSMRESRSRRRAATTSEIMQYEENEEVEDVEENADVSMDISNGTDQVLVDTTNDSPIPMIDYSTYSVGSKSPDESEINSDDSIDDDEVEIGSDDDDIDEFINAYDLNGQTKLFSSSSLSVRDACFTIITLARRLNLNKNGIKNLLNGIRDLFPLDVKLPYTVKGLMKVIGFDCSKEVKYYCCECQCRLQNPKQITCTDGCRLNGKRRPFMNVGELVTNDVKDEIRSTAKRYLNLINEYSNCSSDLLPCDLPNGSIYKRLKIENQKQLTILLHTDGAPVTKVGGKSLWPVQATILEIAPPIRDHISAVMVFAAWLGGVHPNRELLWCNVVDQLQDLYENGIIIRLNDKKRIKFNIRVQLVTFDLPALAHSCNIIQFNGYDACPFCKIHGHAIGTQVYYSYSPVPSARKSDDDYLRLSSINLPKSRSNGIKGRTPLTKIMLFPIQISVDYMHLVCSGHFKTLVTYWSNLLLPSVFEQASNFVLSITLPHSFGYQFMPLNWFTKWKTKMFRDLLLYISPILAVLFLPDVLALHFLHYFIYIRILHFYQNQDELHDIDLFFDYYYQHLAQHYGPKSELCTVHIHTHLLDQVKRHGALSMTSCFPRESYIGHAVKLCKGQKYILEQFNTWYKLDRILYPDSTLNISYLTRDEHLDEKYLVKSLIESVNEKFVQCCYKKNIQLNGTNPIKIYARYFRGLKTFHSLSYGRGGNAISYWVSVKTNKCPQNHKICFGEVIYYFRIDNDCYAFIKYYSCIDDCLSHGLLTTNVPQNLIDRLNVYYHFFQDKRYSYKIVPAARILNKVIRMSWIEPGVSVFTELHLDWEHN